VNDGSYRKGQRPGPFLALSTTAQEWLSKGLAAVLKQIRNCLGRGTTGKGGRTWIEGRAQSSRVGRLMGERLFWQAVGRVLLSPWLLEGIGQALRQKCT
jgi:hypothetical protein